MDKQRFDEIARAVAAGGTRRGLVKGLGGALAGLLGATGLDAGAASRPRNRKRWFCVCNAPGTRCENRRLPERRGRAKVEAGQAVYGKCGIDPLCGGRCRSDAGCIGLTEPGTECRCVFDMDDTVGTCRPVPIDQNPDPEGAPVR